MIWRKIEFSKSCCSQVEQEGWRQTCLSRPRLWLVHRVSLSIFCYYPASKYSTTSQVSFERLGRIWLCCRFGINKMLSSHISNLKEGVVRSSKLLRGSFALFVMGTFASWRGFSLIRLLFWNYLMKRFRNPFHRVAAFLLRVLSLAWILVLHDFRFLFFRLNNRTVN